MRSWLCARTFFVIAIVCVISSKTQEAEGFSFGGRKKSQAEDVSRHANNEIGIEGKAGCSGPAPQGTGYISLDQLSAESAGSSLFEFRIPQPLTIEEQRMGLKFMAQRNFEREKNGDAGPVVEIELEEEREHETFGRGTYSRKKFHVDRRLPSWIRALVRVPVTLEEEAWNLFPLMISTLKLPVLPGFRIRIQSIYLNGMGHENAHGLDDCALGRRVVVGIDIGNSSDVSKAVYRTDEDPSIVGTGDGRGIIHAGWSEHWDGSLSTCYKILFVELPWTIPFQKRVESWIQGFEYDIFKRAARQAYAWAFEWKGMNSSL